MLDLTPHRRASPRHPRLAGLGLEPLAASFDGAGAGGRARRPPEPAQDRADGSAPGGRGRQHLRLREPASRPPVAAAGMAGWPASGGRAGRLAAGDPGGAARRRSAPAARRCATTSRPNGELGFYQDRFAVYGRAGVPCPACGRPVEKLVQGQRATYLVQPLPALRSSTAAVGIAAKSGLDACRAVGPSYRPLRPAGRHPPATSHRGSGRSDPDTSSSGAAEHGRTRPSWSRAAARSA